MKCFLRLLLFLGSLFLFFSCADNRMTTFDFLVGTWKIEGKEQYEAWEKNSKNEFSGHSYKIDENQKTNLESSAIKMIDNQIIYEATVPDQNDRKTIQFILNSDIKSYFSFENIRHDFPKKIQYHKKSENEITIRVLGDEGKGFSYTLIKQETEYTSHNKV